MKTVESAFAAEHQVNILLLLGIAIFLGALGGKLFQRLRIPQVVGYIVIGILLGQTGFGILPETVVEEMMPMSMFALGLIGFMIGGELKLSELKKRGWQFICILLSEGISAFLLVGGATGALTWLFTGDLKKSLAVGMLFGSISSATAPAATVSVLWEYKTRGPLTNTLLAIVALDDGLGLLLFGFAASVAGLLLSGSPLSAGAVIGTPTYEIAASIALGAVSALLLNLLLRWSSDAEKQLVFTLGTVMLIIGISILLKMDSIMAAMALGTTLVNLAPRRSRDAFELIEKFTPPIYVLFFVLVGAELKVFGTGFHIWAIAVVYVLGRSLGKIAGTFFGAVISNAPEVVKRYLGFGLFAQGGVAIGLSIMASQRFESTIGSEILIVVTATTFIVELLGPPFVKFAVTKAGEVGRGVSEEDLISSYSVADMMDPNPPVINLNDRIEEIMEVIGASETYLHYPVINGEREFQGVIGLESLKPILADQSALNELLVAYDLMAVCRESVTPETDLREALGRMRETGLDFLPVLKPNGTARLIGFLDRRVVNKKLSVELLKRKRAAGPQQESPQV
jgi:Kef-type K+ transport system membrane component KefB